MEDVANRSRKPANKGYSNETTLPFDVTEASLAKEILLSLTETLAARVRADKSYISVVSVYFVDNEFKHTSRQMTLNSATNVTNEIYYHVCQLFDQLWNGNPIRLLGVHISKATTEAHRQYSLFETQNVEKLSKLDAAIDKIRNKYGEDSVMRASFVKTEDQEEGLKHMSGGLGKAKRDNK